MRARLLTVAEVAEWLAVSQGWVREHATKKRRPHLPCIRLGKSIRFREDQVEEWIRMISSGRAA